jgi:indolepyruvate ferredoxin oxidoreductase, beta subunit
MSTTRDIQPISLLIAAMGGEGGGVLTSWIVNAARTCGLPVQATSIPGVAQRTGATTYYIEIWPEPLPNGAAKPVLALAPAIGEVDILAATEFVETGRMIEAGYVTPDRTTLIASNHRVYTTHEKVAMGDGRTDVEPIGKAIDARTSRKIVFDMRTAAAKSGAVINAVVLGAIAGAGVLPIPTETFEAGIRAEGKAVDANLKGFQSGLAAATTMAAASGEAGGDEKVRSLLSHRISNTFPLAAHEIMEEAATRLIEYQDVAYAEHYLQRLERFATGDQDLLCSLARHLAVRMGYEDIFRVAQVKIKSGRMMRIRSEAGAADGEPVKITEFFKPRLSEISDALPSGLGRWLEGIARRNPGLGQKSWPMFVETTSFSGYFRLWVLASLRRIRRSTLRHGVETRAIEEWLDIVGKAELINHRVAFEISECAGLIKGYGDTHERGMRSFSTIMDLLVRPAIADGDFHETLADRIIDARAAALADPEGRSLAISLRQAA